MISVIVCSKYAGGLETHRRHVELTIGFPHEYIPIDNSENRHSLCSAYNAGTKAAKGDLCVFVHEDVFFLTPAWGSFLWRKFHNPRVGIVGLAGSQLLLPESQRWFAAGRPYLKGHVVHHDGDMIISTPFSPERSGDHEVAVVDGLMMAVRSSLFKSISFDEKVFDSFHFYDLDICMQARRTHDVIVTCDILVKHLSGGAFYGAWDEQAKKFLNKYAAELPARANILMKNRDSNSIPSLKTAVQNERKM